MKTLIKENQLLLSEMNKCVLMHNKATADVSSIAACFHSWPRAAGQWWVQMKSSRNNTLCTQSKPSEPVLMKCMISSNKSNIVSKCCVIALTTVLKSSECMFTMHSNALLPGMYYAHCALHVQNNQITYYYICQHVQNTTDTLIPWCNASLAISTVPNEPKATSREILISL